MYTLDSLHKIKQSSTQSPTVTTIVVTPLGSSSEFTAINNAQITPAPQQPSSVINIFKGVFLLGLVAVTTLLFTVSQNQQLFVITSGSMEPAIHTGSIIAISPATSAHYNVQDIVAFETSKGVVTHRIVEMFSEAEETRYQTKGDANGSIDPRSIQTSDILGKLRFSIPYGGYPIQWMSTKIGFALLILLPATIIVLQELRVIHHTWRDINMRRTKLMPALATPLVLLTLIPFSYALLTSNSTAAPQNSFSVAVITPSPTPSPTPSVSPSPTPTTEPSPEPSPEPSGSPEPSPSPTPDVDGICDTDIQIDASNENTGPDSTNTNDVDIDIDCDVTEETDVDIDTDVDVDVNTGGNSQNGNTNGGGINTGDVEIDLSF